MPKNNFFYLHRRFAQAGSRTTSVLPTNQGAKVTRSAFLSVSHASLEVNTGPIVPKSTWLSSGQLYRSLGVGYR